ncbi:hypothetical protein [uncultured Alistipes sp.]|uniref:hypothetical protein n=1 Tax=uncultured Alistipes sp. TaxID=538949 RepID=UPI0025D98385|nr:hypothetical protein [uncultured Alistipes sp.]
MNQIKSTLLAIFLSVLFHSCSTTKNAIGHYESHDKLSSTDLIITNEGTFIYKFTGEGFGRKEWSYGQWAKVNDNEILLTSIRHDSLPISVREEKQNTEERIVIMLPNDAVWKTDATILINGQPIKIPKDQVVISLPSKDFSAIRTISIEADISNDDILVELANYSYIKTITYNVEDISNNTFHLSFPFYDPLIDLYSCFYLKEFHDIITVKKNLSLDNAILKRKL